MGRIATRYGSFEERKARALAKHSKGIPLTYEETAYAMATSEDDLMSRASVQYIERSALKKLKKALSELGITSLEDLA